MSGARVSKIDIKNQNVFDLNRPREKRWYSRLINHLHYTTRESTIRRELLFDEGEPYHPEILEESERHLRRLPYLVDARIHVDTSSGRDVRVKTWTQDSWSTEAGMNFSRNGGRNRTRLHLAEKNFLGTGNRVTTEYAKTEERNTVGFNYINPNLSGRHDNLNLEYGHSSDGNNEKIAYAHPFYSIWKSKEFGFQVDHTSRVVLLSSGNAVLGQYSEKSKNGEIYYGRKLSGNLYRAFRLTGGYRYQSSRRSPMAGLVVGMPPSLRHSGLFLRGHWQNQKFIKKTNLDKFGLTEDINLAPVVSLEGFWNAFEPAPAQAKVILRGNVEKAFAWSGTHVVKNVLGAVAPYAQDGLANAVLSSNSHWYYSFRSWQTLVVHLQTGLGIRPDGSTPISLGGENGLRGYPAHSFTGRWKILFNVEDRIFTPVTFFRSIQLGGAVFYDAGDAGTGRLGPLKQSAGGGLRLGVLRSASAHVIRIDLARPLQRRYIPDLNPWELSIGTGHAF